MPSLELRQIFLIDISPPFTPRLTSVVSINLGLIDSSICLTESFRARREGQPRKSAGTLLRPLQASSSARHSCTSRNSKSVGLLLYDCENERIVQIGGIRVNRRTPIKARQT